MPKRNSSGNGPRKKPENGVRNVPQKKDPKDANRRRPYKPTSTKGE